MTPPVWRLGRRLGGANSPAYFASNIGRYFGEHDTRARAASARALRYGSHSYPAIKNILARGLDLSPEPEDEIQWQTTLPAPRFARSADSFSLLAKEVLHECNR